MQIGELAARTGMSLNTLRHYDEVGLVSPSRRSRGGFRLYSEDDLQLLLVIRRMKPLGYGVEEMRSLLRVVQQLSLSGGDEHERLLVQLDQMIGSARDRRAGLGRKLEMADEFVAMLSGLDRNPTEGQDPTLG